MQIYSAKYNKFSLRFIPYKILKVSNSYLISTFYIIYLSFLLKPAYADERNQYAKIEQKVVKEVDGSITDFLNNHYSWIDLEYEDKKQLIELAHCAINKHFYNFIDSSLCIPFSKNNATQAFKVYVTLLVNNKVRACQSAQEQNIAESVILATKRSINDIRFGGKLLKPEIPNTRIHISLVGPGITIKEQSIDSIKNTFELGVHGLSIEHGSNFAFFKASVPVKHGYSTKKLLERISIKAKLGKHGYKDSNSILKKHNTFEFQEDFSTRKPVDLFRGYPIYYQSEVKKEKLLNSLELAATYIANNIDSLGRLTYLYNVKENKKIYDYSSTPSIRCLASIWALAEAGSFLNNEDFTSKAKFALSLYFDNYFVHDTSKNIGYFLFGNNANIATASFVILTLNTINDTSFYNIEKTQLLNFLVSMYDKKKGYFYPVLLPDKQSFFSRKEIYYPGEALTALMNEYVIGKNKEYLWMVENCFDYYQKLYKRTHKKASLTPWITRAYSALYNNTNNSKYFQFIWKINQHVLTYQNTYNCTYPDIIGSYFSNKQVYSTGVYIESSCEVIKNSSKQAFDNHKISSSVLIALRYLLQNQYTSCGYSNIYGGFRTSIYNSDIRIDSVQHAICSIISFLSITLF